MIRFGLALVAAAFLLSPAPVTSAGDGNRLTYLEENNPWYPHTGFARLTTPQWVGDEGVEAVVILAIDDMRDPAKYEAFLRPILQRLKAIDGRAPVSIMTCNVKPDDPQLQSWLGEGLSIECHTVDHPCPLLQGSDFEKAKSTYDRCVDALNQIPGNTPVAFRTPCCDSLNTVSPRFFEEIFNSRTPNRNFLQMDSSVFCVFTEDDPEIPAELVTDPDGTPKFRKYLPKGLERNGIVHNQFVNWIENYPYPYVINGTCWEIPCMAPSDWEANFYHQPNNPLTVRDMETALDITVLKQGVFCMVFHPHGWIRSDQIVEFIDHAVSTHGEKVKFLTFPEALARLNGNLLDGNPLRDEQGRNNVVRILDVDNEGSMDVVIGGQSDRMTRLWRSDARRWEEHDFPVSLQPGESGLESANRLFGIAGETGATALFDLQGARGWVWRGGEWHEQQCRGQHPFSDYPAGRIAPWDLRPAVSWLRDFPGYDESFLVLTWAQTPRNSDDPRQATWSYTWRDDGWGEISAGFFQTPDSFDLTAPYAARAVRFVDLNGDGGLDMIYSDAERYAIYLFRADGNMDYRGHALLSGRRGEQPPAEELPPIVREDGTDNGFFIHSGYLLWQNEDTANLPDMVEKRSIAELLGEDADEE